MVTYLRQTHILTFCYAVVLYQGHLHEDQSWTAKIMSTKSDIFHSPQKVEVADGTH